MPNKRHCLVLLCFLIGHKLSAATFPPTPLRAPACVTAYDYRRLLPALTESEYRDRVDLVEHARRPFDRHHWVLALAHSGRLLHSHTGEYIPGQEFLASNEDDWETTPFNGKKADVIVAYGTNSAWEIAADQRVTDAVFADSSPFPILAQAFLVEPLLRISDTAVDFIRALVALPPAPVQDSVQSALYQYGSESLNLPEHRVRDFLLWLAHRPEIRSDELQFISSYFWHRVSGQYYTDGPFFAVREPLFTHLPFNYGMRYEGHSAEVLRRSVLHNPILFKRLRNLFEGHVRYAFSDVADAGFYRLLKRKYPHARRWTVSLTNIFDMPYHRHSPQTLPSFLSGLLSILGTDGNSLTVFRTKGLSPPHEYVRYDLRMKSDIPVEAILSERD